MPARKCVTLWGAMNRGVCVYGQRYLPLPSWSVTSWLKGSKDMEMFGSYPCCIYGDWNRSNSKNCFLLLCFSFKLPSHLKVKELYRKTGDLSSGLYSCTEI